MRVFSTTGGDNDKGLMFLLCGVIIELSGRSRYLQ